MQSTIFRVMAGFLFILRSIPDRTLRQLLLQFRPLSDAKRRRLHGTFCLVAVLSLRSATEICCPIDVFWIDTVVFAIRSASSCQQRKAALLTSSTSPQDCSKACFTTLTQFSHSWPRSLPT